jgi:hypothetical protein
VWVILLFCQYLDTVVYNGRAAGKLKEFGRKLSWPKRRGRRNAMEKQHHIVVSALLTELSPS